MGATAYRGITVFADSANSWVATRTLWNQHSYHVTNICNGNDNACEAASNTYGAIPEFQIPNVAVSWLNNFRQNVQGNGIFDAPDPTIELEVECDVPIVLHGYVRNLGAAQLPAGVDVGFYVSRAGTRPCSAPRRRQACCSPARLRS